MFEVVFVNFEAPFRFVFAHPGASGPQNPVPDDLTALATSHESSGAHRGLYF